VRGVGRVGFKWAERHRKPIMFSAFLMSFVSWAFLIFATCALTNHRPTVVSTAWVVGRLDSGI
jgi:hypothetical protein